MIRQRFEEIVAGFTDRPILVVGDLMMDEYLWGRATRISPESPVMVVEVERESSVPGGAANVVNNILALGGRVHVIGVVGDDAKGRLLYESLKERGASVSGVITDTTRPTTRKTRIVAHNQQVMRVDREQTHGVSDAISADLISALIQAASVCSAIVVSDYNKGVLTESVARAAIRVARERGISLTANPKPSNAQKLAGASVISLNQSEAESLAGTSRLNDDGSVEVVGRRILKDLNVDALIITRGARGLSVWTRDGEMRHIDAHPVEVYDVAGAGDTVISALTLGLAAGATVFEAADVANRAAACVVRHLGVATVSQRELAEEF